MNNVGFIHSRLDEAGLNPGQFRVLCHILRRDKCLASVLTISQVCQMHKDTVWRALRVLEARRMINRTRRQGSTTVFTVADPDIWTSEPTGNGGVPENEGHPSLPSRGGGNGGVPTHPEIRGTKVFQNKVFQNKSFQDKRPPTPISIPADPAETPDVVEDDGFEEFWAVYPKKTAKVAARRAFKKIKPCELARIIANIAHRLENDPQWTKDGGAFIPYPATYLNGRRWEDEATPAPAAKKEPKWGTPEHGQWMLEQAIG
ncbi:MAG: MarR family transcriptional regulator [Verrucomicrobiae bacterium]|nr:MarR family transcriptional regulator [Verrucomicrobiae bacterium]